MDASKFANEARRIAMEAKEAFESGELMSLGPWVEVGRAVAGAVAEVEKAAWIVAEGKGKDSPYIKAAKAAQRVVFPAAMLPETDEQTWADKAKKYEDEAVKSARSAYGE